MAAEGYTFFFYLPHLPQAEHLKAAAVREDGLFPVHEFVQAAGFFYEIFAGTQE